MTADDLMKVHDFILAHKDELQNGELSEEDLLKISGGISDQESEALLLCYPLAILGGFGVAIASILMW